MGDPNIWAQANADIGCTENLKNCQRCTEERRELLSLIEEKKGGKDFVPRCVKHLQQLTSVVDTEYFRGETKGSTIRRKC